MTVFIHRKKKDVAETDKMEGERNAPKILALR
jgi:hypothetical protein